jgi:hypothetical protein
MTDEQLDAVLKALAAKTDSKVVIVVDDPKPKTVFISVDGDNWSGVVFRPDGAILIREGKLAPTA